MSQTIGSKPKDGAKAVKATGSKRAVGTKKAHAAATPKSRAAVKSTRAATRARQTAASAQHGHPAVSKPASMARRTTGNNVGAWCKGPCGFVFGGLRHLLGYAMSFIGRHTPK